MAQQDLDLPDDSDGMDNVLDLSPAAYAIAQRRRAMVGAVNDLEANPDDAARAQQLSRATGTPPSLVYGNLEGFQQQHKAALTSAILDNNPYIRDYIQRNPLGSKISNDDWGALDEMSKAMQRAPEFFWGSSLVQAAKDFGEGFGRPGFFGTAPKDLEEAQAHPGAGAAMAVATIAGAPLDLAVRAPGGVINAAVQGIRRAYEGVTGQSAEAQTEQFLQTISDPGLLATLGPLAGPAEALTEGLRLRSEVQRTAPYIKASELPPPGVSPIIDQARQEENKAWLKFLTEQGRAASATSTIERDPQSFKDFVNAHRPEHIELQADAVRSIYGDEPITPGDGRFGDIPGFNEELALAERHNGHVQVPLADWLLFQHENPDEAKFLQKYASRPGGVTQAEGEALTAAHAQRPDEEAPANENIEGARPTIGALSPEELSRRLEKVLTEHPEYRQVPYGVENKFIEDLPYKDYVKFMNGEQLLKPVPQAIDSVRQAARLDPVLTREFGEPTTVMQFGEPGDQVTYAIPEKAFTDAEAKIVSSIDKYVKSIAPNFDLENLIPTRAVSLGGQAAHGVAHVTPFQSVIFYALHDAQGKFRLPEDILGTVRHEMIHVFKRGGFFTKSEWSRLEEAAAREDWLGKYKIHDRYPGVDWDTSIEEAIAEEFGEWNLKPRSTHIAADLFQKLRDALLKIRDLAIQHLGFDPKVEDIFHKIESGEIGSRDPQAAAQDRIFGKPKAQREPELPGISRLESRPSFRTPGAAGLSADAMRRYLGLIEKQNKVEADHIQSKALEEERKRQTSQWKEDEKRVKGEVREGIYRRPDIAADRYLREGILDGRKAGNFKLDKKALNDDQLRSLSPEYYGSDGANPDDMAQLFGYQSGDALVQALGSLKAERDLEGLTPAAHISKLVDVATEHEMQRQYGDLEENILREAKEHVFSPSQIDILADETIHLASLAGSELPITKEDLLKGAKQVFDAAPLRAIDSKAFEASSARAGQAVQDALLKGDYRAALKAKQEQAHAAIYANLALKFEKGLKRFQEIDAPRWGRREPPGVPQEDAVWMHQILRQVLGPDGIQTSLQDLERRKEMSSPYKSLRDYVEGRNKSNGTASTDPDNPTTVPNLAVMSDLFSENWPGKDFEGLSTDEFRQVYDSLKSINHYGHEANKYEVKGNKEDLAKVTSGLIERLKAAVNYKTAVDAAHETSVFRNIGSLLLNTETWLNRLDLGNRRGPFNQLILRPITEGQYELRQFEKDFAARWKDLGTYPDFTKKINNNLFRDKNGAIEMTKGNAYVVLQNMGNALQRKKLIQGWGIDKDQAVGEQKVWDWLKNVAGMTEEDLARAQKMGKIFNDAFELSEKAYVHVAGVAPARIELYKVQTPWGVANEWYHPLIADPLRHQSHWTAEEAMQAGESGFWKPSPAAGYTKGRTGAVYPIDLSFKSAAFKLRQILNDAAMRIPITEVGKIVYNKEFQEAFKRYYGPEYHQALDAWMKDSAGNRQWQPGNIATLDRWVNAVAQNMSTALIGFNPSTIMKHGLTAAVFSAWEVGPLNWASSMLYLGKELPGSRQTWRWVMENSEEVRNRLHHIEDTLSNQNRELFPTDRSGFTGKIKSLRDAVSWYGHFPVGFADLISAVSMFHAEYKRLNEADPTMSHGDLVYAANTAVRRTHGSSILSNRSGIQRHYSPWVRLSMPFYNFLGNALQRNYENTWMAKLAVQGRELPEMTGFAREKFDQGPKAIKNIIGGVMVFGLTVGLVEWLVEKLTGNQPKQQPNENQGAFWAKQVLRGYTAQVPLVRDFANSMIEGHEPSVGLYGTVARDIGQELNPKSYSPRDPGKALRSGLDLLGITTGLTTQPADKLAEYVTNVLAGHEHPKGLGDLWTGALHGTQQRPRR